MPLYEIEETVDSDTADSYFEDATSDLPEELEELEEGDPENLSRFAAAGRLEDLQRFIKDHPEAFASPESFADALDAAASHGEVEIIKYLNKMKPGCWSTYDDKWALLRSLASPKISLTAIQYFHETKPEWFSSDDGFGGKCVLYATEFGRLNILKYFFKTTPSWFDEDFPWNCTPAHKAAKHNWLECMKFFYSIKPEWLSIVSGPDDSNDFFLDSHRMPGVSRKLMKLTPLNVCLMSSFDMTKTTKFIISRTITSIWDEGRDANAVFRLLWIQDRHGSHASFPNAYIIKFTIFARYMAQLRNHPDNISLDRMPMPHGIDETQQAKINLQKASLTKNILQAYQKYAFIAAFSYQVKTSLPLPQELLYQIAYRSSLFSESLGFDISDQDFAELYRVCHSRFSQVRDRIVERRVNNIAETTFSRLTDSYSPDEILKKVDETTKSTFTGKVVRLVTSKFNLFTSTEFEHCKECADKPFKETEKHAPTLDSLNQRFLTSWERKSVTHESSEHMHSRPSS